MSYPCFLCGAVAASRSNGRCSSCQHRPEYIPSPSRYGWAYPDALLAADRAIGERWYSKQVDVLLERYGALSRIPRHEHLVYD